MTSKMSILRKASYMLMLILMACGCVSAGPDAGIQTRSESERSGWAGTSAEFDPEQAADGQRIAQRECASCHSIDRTSVSPNQSAPPLREVLAMNDPDFLAYRFIDAMRVGHDEMPLFDFDVRSADALIAYIKSISGG